MKQVIKNRWDGGVYDPRETVLSGCSSVRHFMLNKTKLTPYRDMETEALDAGTLANQRLSCAIRYKCTSQVENIYALGQVSTVNQNAKFYVKSSANSPSASFTALGTGESAGVTVIPGTLIGFQGALYCLGSDGTDTRLVKHVHGASTTLVANLGTIPVNGVYPQMFVHPKDTNKLYAASGNTVSVWDNSSVTNVVFSNEYEITSICPYGNNILVGMVAKNGSGSVVGVWSGSTASNALVDVVDFGSDTLLVLENVGDIVIGISGLSVGGGLDVGTQNTVTVRKYIGGTAQVVQEVESIGTSGSKVYPLKAKRNNMLFFPMSAYLNGTQVHQIWTVYINESGQLVIAPDRKMNNDTEVASGSTPVIGLSLVGDWMWVAYGANTTGSFMRTNDTDTSFTATSSYETLVNPGMEAVDRSAKKKLKALSLRCGSPTGTSHTVTVSYSVDGGAYRTIYTGAASSKVRVIEQTGESDAKNFIEGREYTFKVESTGNGEIYELKYGYEVVPTQFR